MAELEERLEVLCQTAALLILKQPERSKEIEGEIADVFRVPADTVHTLIVQQMDHLHRVERHAPVQHA